MYRSPKVSVPGMVDELVVAGRAPSQAATEIENALRDDALFLTSTANPTSPKHKDDAIEFLQSYARWPQTTMSADFAARRLKEGEVYALRSEFERVCELVVSDPSPPAVINTDPTPRRGTGGRKPVVDWQIVRAEALRLLDDEGAFDPADPKWNSQERLVERLQRFCQDTFGHEPGRTSITDRLPQWRAEWRPETGAA